MLQVVKVASARPQQPLFPVANGVEGTQPSPLIPLPRRPTGVLRQARLLDLAHGPVRPADLTLARGGVSHAPAAHRGKERLARREDQHRAALAAQRAESVEALAAEGHWLGYHLELLIDRLAEGASLDADPAAVNVSDDGDGAYGAPAASIDPALLAAGPEVALERSVAAQVGEREAQAVVGVARGRPSARSEAAHVLIRLSSKESAELSDV